MRCVVPKRGLVDAVASEFDLTAAANEPDLTSDAADPFDLTSLVTSVIAPATAP